MRGLGGVHEQKKYGADPTQSRPSQCLPALFTLDRNLLIQLSTARIVLLASGFARRNRYLRYEGRSAMALANRSQHGRCPPPRFRPELRRPESIRPDYLRKGIAACQTISPRRAAEDVLACTRFCAGESIRHQQIALAFNERRATTSILSSYGIIDCTDSGYPLNVPTCSVRCRCLRRALPRWRWRFPLW